MSRLPSVTASAVVGPGVLATAADNPIVARVIKLRGSGAKLAREIGVTKCAIQEWKRTGIPARRVGQVAALTGLSPQELRPDLFPAAPGEAA